MELLHRYPWPGNIRELQSVLKQALLQAAGPVLLPDFLPASVTGATAAQRQRRRRRARRDWSRSSRPGCTRAARNCTPRRWSALERLLLTRVLRHTGGNQLQAAKILGITRGSLRTKIRDLGIRIDRTVSGGDEDEKI